MMIKVICDDKGVLYRHNLEGNSTRKKLQVQNQNIIMRKKNSIDILKHHLKTSREIESLVTNGSTVIDSEPKHTSKVTKWFKDSKVK